ncbi:hypothetical protein [Streptomyces sp. NPDC048521]|uniref:hypothetical protein n=1 Tax=Streptomyces sp. NPDC048521 TaxID=3365566 RepID=UPI0037173D4B
MERTFAWCLRIRRLVRDHERRTDTSQAVILWSMTMLMSRRLAARHQDPAPTRAARTCPASALPASPAPPAASAVLWLLRRADALSQPSTTAARRAPSPSPASSAAAINAS